MSAPAPVMLKTPLEKLELPLSPVAPMSALVHGTGRLVVGGGVGVSLTVASSSKSKLMSLESGTA